ncbi:MAG: methyltransferase domain-containing protein [Bryobacteraceae bacterium]|nr:methyltransferase domain-containing protein [Bryobacteraceae bacterium]MDW8379571.1 methyltransferase domain-containing protein [Bryobacterales bacterium]
MAEFTGERVIPGKVHPDLWNEHFARYAFAARLARQKRVLDIASGSGYGSAELATVAQHVVGVDISEEAIEAARSSYALPNLFFQVASAEQLPFPDASFDLIVAFEVIEHLANWRGLLAEAQRLLAPDGQFVVSTPNRLYYEETRAVCGPNPYHVHEFEFEEFRSALRAYFPYVSMFLQNHTSVIVFEPLEGDCGSEARVEAAVSCPATSHFFVAVCAQKPLPAGFRFVYLPTTSNVLREREQHIAKLENELEKKNRWLERSLLEHEQLVKIHTEQTEELKRRSLWAQELNQQLEATQARVVELQQELAAEQKAGAETAAQYEAKIAELEADLKARTRWAQELEASLSQQLAQKCEELAQCVEILHQTESDLEERTRWALSLQSDLEQAQARLSSVVASRWYRLGRSFGLGPELNRK